MTGLKEVLLKEQGRLENIIAAVKRQLENTPPGSLRISTSKNGISYYHYQITDKGNGTYISRKNNDLIQKLAQKTYNEKVLKYAEKRLQYVKRLADSYDDNGIEGIYEQEHPGRQKWIHPIEPTWKQRVDEWLKEEYQGKGFKETDPFIYTERGGAGSAQSQKRFWRIIFIVTTFHISMNIPLYLTGFGIVYPDFTVLSQRTRHEMYWEHNGRMDDPAYARKAVKKLQNYEKNNIFVGEKLILTYETEQSVIQTKDIERLARKYLV